MLGSQGSRSWLIRSRPAPGFWLAQLLDLGLRHHPIAVLPQVLIKPRRPAGVDCRQERKTYSAWFLSNLSSLLSPHPFHTLVSGFGQPFRSSLGLGQRSGTSSQLGWRGSQFSLHIMCVRRYIPTGVLVKLCSYKVVEASGLSAKWP